MGTVQQQNDSADHILNAAVTIFAKKGYEATSTREIIEAAGVTKPMLYYYFGSKEGLCRAAINQIAEFFFGCLRTELDQPRDPRETLVEIAWLQFRLIEEKPEVNRFFLTVYFGPERNTFLRDIEAVAEKIHALLMEAIGRAVEAGVIRPECQEDFFMAYHHLINGWSVEAMDHRASLSRELAERIVDGLLQGYGTKEN